MGHSNNNTSNIMHRRRFLRQSLSSTALVGTATVGTESWASAVTGGGFESVSDGFQPVLSADEKEAKRLAELANQEPDRKLRLVNAHTWEKLDLVFWSQGEFVKDSLEEINYLMRDHRANEFIRMDVKLIDDLYNLYNLLESKERIHILSGYRTKATNAKLRSRSNGVAKFSLHMEGRAVDISLPGRNAKQIQQAAISLQAGGVGYYASSGFVHIDTGNVRHWNRA